MLICYPLLVWTTGWIRSKKRLGSWKDHEATAPVRCAKNLFNRIGGYGGPLDRLYIKGIYVFLGLHQETQKAAAHVFQHVGGPLDRL